MKRSNTSPMWQHPIHTVIDTELERLAKRVKALEAQVEQLRKDAFAAMGGKVPRSDVCCICGREIDYVGHNPYPVKPHPTSPYSKGDKCCHQCNENIVIPARNDQDQTSGTTISRNETR